MRYIVLFIFIYCLYLFLKFLLKLYINSINRKKTEHSAESTRPRRKIDLSKISEADYEEIKTPKQKK